MPWPMGKRFSEEHRKKISEALTRFYLPDLSPSPELSYVLGVIHGDGYLTWGNRTGYIGLDNKNIAFIKEFNRCITKILNRKKLYAITRTKDGHPRVVGKSKFLYYWLKEHRYDWEIFSSIIDPYPASFIRGFADSEGCVHMNRGYIAIHLANSNKDILNFIRKLLKDKFSIEVPPPRVAVPKGTKSKIGLQPVTTKKDCYEITIYKQKDIRTFADQIGFAHNEKTNLLELW